MLANLLYAAALLTVSPVVVYRMVRYGRYRRGIAEKLWGLSTSRARDLAPHDGCVWFHAVSVGEVHLLRGIVTRMQTVSPTTPIAVSSSTDSGYDLAVECFGAERVFFCPLDFSWAVKRTLRRLRPAGLVLVELELWPNLIRQAQRYGCKTLVVNGRLSARSGRRYQRAGRLIRPTFARLDWVGCQDDASRSRFIACGTDRDRVATTGSIKFDLASTSRECSAVQACLHWSGADPWHRIWLVGSTQRGEEAMALRVYRQLREDHRELRLILVPRHRERFDEVARLIADEGLSAHRRSADRSMYEETWNQETVILIDTIGELRDWWGVSQIATVGGSFGDRGGQNMLEPAGYGCAVSFGPDTRNFREIADRLITAGGAVRVENERELADFVRRCLDDPPAADSLGSAARQVVQSHRGATERTIDGILDEIGIAHRRLTGPARAA